MNKRVKRIKDNFVLSIRYARLKEELEYAEAKKRNLLGGNGKKIDSINEFIDSVCRAINKIEQNNSPSAYSLIVNDKASEQLKLLSKQKNHHLIKYSIAIEMILDEEFEYTENTNDFVEKISSMLFDDKDTIKKMNGDYKRISNCIYGKHDIRPHLEAAAKLITKIPFDSLVVGAVPKKVVSSAALIVSMGLTNLSKKKQAKKISALSADDFAKRLIICAMNLLYAKIFIRSDVEYANFFKAKLKEVNFERRLIMKELFEKQCEIEDNQIKIGFLHNFDHYLIKQLT